MRHPNRLILAAGAPLVVAAALVATGTAAPSSATAATTTTIAKLDKPPVPGPTAATGPTTPLATSGSTDDTTDATVEASGSTDATAPSTEPSAATTDRTSSSGGDDVAGDGVIGTGDFQVDDLTWGPCDPDEDVAAPSDCATVTVPLDYAEPDGETIDLALIRYPATGQREGMILTNPGGPGGSGFELVNNAGSVLSSEMGLQNFDIIGFDPRGVDRSNGLRCLDDATEDKYLYLDYTPDTPEEQQLVDEESQVFADACQAEYGDTLADYSTINTARDMDLIRQAAGDDQISYLGISYGTYLGAVYATLFPDQVRAMVLDSAFEPTGDSEFDAISTQLVGFEGAFDNWATWCEKTPDKCPFSGPDVGQKWDELRTSLDADEIAADDGRIANADVFETATVSALYSQSAWPDLGGVLADAAKGDVNGLFRLADDMEGREPDGTFKSLNQSSAVIRCASGLSWPVPADPEATLERLREVAPRFSVELTAEQLADDNCTKLLGSTIDPFVPHYDGDAPILVVGGTDDPATPFRWATELTDLMGPSAALVQFNGEGHGQVIASTCVTEHEAATIVDLEVPPAGTECDPDPEVTEPSWWADLPVPDGIGEPVDIPSLSSGLGLSPTQYFSEVRLTDMSATEVLDAYKTELEGSDLTFLTDQEPIPGVPESGYLAPDGQVFIVLAIDPQAFQDSEDLQGLDADVPDGKTVVVVAAFEM